MLGAGIGLGAGLPIGGQLGQSLNIQNNQNTGSSDNSEDPHAKIKKLKEMLDENLITEEQFNKKREEILSKI